VGYVCEVQIFAKFSNEGSTCKNFCWKREILIFSSEKNLTQAFSRHSILWKSALCLANLAIAKKISARGHFSSVAKIWTSQQKPAVYGELDTCFWLFLLFVWAKLLLIFDCWLKAEVCMWLQVPRPLQLQTLVHFAQLVLVLNLKWLTARNYVDRQVQNWGIEHLPWYKTNSKKELKCSLSNPVVNNCINHTCASTRKFSNHISNQISNHKSG